MDLIEFFLGLPNPLPAEGTESDLRAQVIDPVLDRLGWASNEIKREPYAGWSDSRGFIDYLLLANDKPMMVLEAKKTGLTFRIPDRLKAQHVTTFRKIRSAGSDALKEALDQCLRYAQHTGALYACATNGTDWVIFKPSHPFRSLPDARVIIFNGVDQIVKRIDEFEGLLSSDGIQQGKAEKELLGREIQVPNFAKRLQDAFPNRQESTLEEAEYSAMLDQMLRHYVIELTDEVDFEECYLPAKSNRTASISLEELISTRISAQKAPSNQTNLDFGSEMVAKPLLQNVASGRTVILHGDVGVGKTSFLRHCEMSLRKEGKLEEAVWARVDLLPFSDRSFVQEEVRAMLSLICKSIQAEVSRSTEKLSGRYDPDSWEHLRDIYNSEVRRFQKARYPNSDDSDPVFMEEARKYVWDLSREYPQDHLVRVIRWMTINCKLAVIVALDNSDQLGLPFQEFLYKLSETLKASTSAVVILVVRSEALASHVIREHSIASVREQFLVHKAPLAQVLQRRFSRILQRLPDAYPGTANKAARDRMVVLMDTLKYETDVGSDTFQIVEAAGNGSLRDSLRAVSAIFRSSPKSMDRLVVEQFEKGRARLSVAQTLRALTKEDLGNADATKLIPNIFNVDGQITMPYSLGVREIQQTRAKSHVEYTAGMLLNDFAISGVDRTIVERTLIRLRSDRLISVAHMLPEIRDVDVVRATRLGEVLLDIILAEKSYANRMAFATYIYDKQTYLNMRSAWTSDFDDFYQKFEVIGGQFISLVREDDVELRARIDLSLLEPVVGVPMPGLFSSATSPADE